MAANDAVPLRSSSTTERSRRARDWHSVDRRAVPRLPEEQVLGSVRRLGAGSGPRWLALLELDRLTLTLRHLRRPEVEELDHDAERHGEVDVPLGEIGR